MISKTSKTPYYAVIFTSIRTKNGESMYDQMATKMIELAGEQDGFLGVESARSELGITVSYWKDLESIKKWKMNTQHTQARNLGRELWYKHFKVRICKVERNYAFEEG